MSLADLLLQEVDYLLKRLDLEGAVQVAVDEGVVGQERDMVDGPDYGVYLGLGIGREHDVLLVLLPDGLDYVHAVVCDSLKGSRP